MKAILGFAVIVTFQVCGEVISYYVAPQIPGPIIGMLLLFILSLSWYSVYHYIEKPALNLIRILPLLLLPACTSGFFFMLELTGSRLPLLFGVVFGTLIALFIAISLSKRSLKNSQDSV